MRAVIASEDGRFMEDCGFDINELIKMKKEHQKKGRKIRGCSTISQHVAKTVLLSADIVGGERASRLIIPSLSNCSGVRRG